MITTPNYFGVLVPLAALLAVAGFGYFVAKKTARSTDSRARKWVVGALAGLALALVMLADEVAGRWYLHQLCSTQSGSQIYRQVKLPAEFWRADGSPTFMGEDGSIQDPRLYGRYGYIGDDSEKVSSALNINKVVSTTIVTKTREPLAAYTTFWHSGGWLRRAAWLQGSGCPLDGAAGYRFAREIFVPGSE